ncbi:AraC family transcriptional regulator [Bradyrhizobium sp.]|uniref:AraC family transcriptional regulator n=1 Tax=Bradyrhizobium sp. TaxID=376 RepID=UPI001D72B78B|nr:AraC family transcriptional regulator [Bradyrhizobium sp.]MBV8701116.1 AraC family transcriptional regulator [Bradyrhizobium sp.]MBV8920519.1 AraC family transcriptional regulator [Bradyrhizobium sp.]MBV9981070.1 AraC family transcriptional regulator [Bradyrhizobium sp.]
MTSSRQPFAPLHISTDSFPEKQRLAMWREIYGRNITNVDIETIGDEPFHASVTFQGLPGLGIVSGSRSAAHYHITRQHLPRAGDQVGLSMLLSGASTTQQLGREIVGRPGSGVLISGTDPSANTMRSLGSFVTLVLPRPALAELVPNLGDAYARQIPAENGALRLLLRYIETLHRDDALEMPGLAQASANHIIDIAALAIGAKPDVAHEAHERGVAAARLQAIKADITDQLGNPDLSAGMMAIRHGVTPRYVHKLFEREGTTFSAFVLAHRLARALQMLKDAHFAVLTVSAIALECGFNDLSYFNRTFRRAYGATPSDVRAATQQAR